MPGIGERKGWNQEGDGDCWKSGMVWSGGYFLGGKEMSLNVLHKCSSKKIWPDMFSEYIFHLMVLYENK